MQFLQRGFIHHHFRIQVVMELCDMGSTLDMMRKRQAPLEESAIAWIAAGVLNALDYMHTSRKAIHRDIKVSE